MYWLKNTDDEPDAMLTFATIGFLVVTINIVLATIGTVTIYDTTFNFQMMDSAVMGVYLGATLTAYVGRRFTDRKFMTSENAFFDESENQQEEKLEEKQEERYDKDIYKNEDVG